VTTPLPTASRHGSPELPHSPGRLDRLHTINNTFNPRHPGIDTVPVYPVPDSHSHDSRHEGTSVTYTHTIPHHITISLLLHRYNPIPLSLAPALVDGSPQKPETRVRDLATKTNGARFVSCFF
jgi:hypothetical protein